MSIARLVQVLGVVVAFAAAPAFAVLAQTQPSQPEPPAQVSPPATPQAPPATTPSDPAQKSPMEQAETGKSAKKNPILGMPVFSADGSRLGVIENIGVGGDGKVKAIHFKTGGFLGFGGRKVAIPEGKFTVVGQNVQLALTSDEVSKLPEVKDES
jgi:hypothetical protein